MKKYKIACAIILNDKNQILLTKRARDPFRGFWALTSGIGESLKGIPPEIGITEEVRCDLNTNSFKGKYLFSLPIENGEIADEVVVFVGTVRESELRPNPEFSLGYKWVSESNTKEFEKLAFEHGKIVKEFLKRKSSFSSAT